MKKINSILISAVSLLAFAPIAGAQSIQDVLGNLDFDVKDTKVEGGVGFNKTVASPTSEGIYWIKLEAFSTGQATTTVTSTPSDIILILDSSTSMQQQDYGADDGEYKALPQMSFTYSTFSNTNGYQEPFYGGVTDNTLTHLYYKYNNSYYRISRGGNAQNTSRYLTFRVGTTDYYLNDGLNGGEPSTTAPERNVGPTNNNNTIWTGVLYTTGQMARIDALKNAVNDFIDSIYENDSEVSQANPQYEGNRIAIVTYDANAYKLTSDYSWQTADNQRANWFDIGASGVKDNLKNAVLNMGLHNYTRPDLGMREAIDDLLDGSPTTKRENANLTVVVFTDGVPAGSGDQGNGNYFNSTYANNSVQYGYQFKQTYDANLFTIGLLNKNSTNEHVVRGIHFLDLLSSNYPESNITNGGTWTVSGTTVTVPGVSKGSASDKDPDGDYFQLVDENTDLSSIFDAIAKQSGGSADESLSSATSTVDIVSSSFLLPENATADSIKLFTAKCTSYDAESKTYGFATEILAPKRAVNASDTSSYYRIYDKNGELVEIDGETMFDVDDSLKVVLDKDANGNDRITVKGFDYSNLWCGPVKDENGKVTSINGFKVIILIPVEMNPDAVGGPNVATNAAGSGIYIDPNDPAPHVIFDSPTVSLPVNVHISKKGLNPGESAKFMIYRAEIPVDAQGKELEVWDPEDDIAEADWEYVSTIFVTNSPNTKKDQKGNPMVKVKGMPATVQVGTDPTTGKPIQRGVVYRITEESWSWSYEEDPDAESSGPQYTVTSKVDNPFLFENKKKTDIEMKVRHAESKATNIFKSGVKEGQYDDSKPRSTTSKSK